MTDPADMTPEMFEPLIGEAVTVAGPEGAFALRLDNIRQGSEHTMRDGEVEIDGRLLPARRAFSLALEGPRDPVLAKGCYPVDLPGVGEMVLFVSPFHRDQRRTLYEIGFN